VAIASAGPHANLHLDPDITTPAPHHSVFFQAGCPSCHLTNSIKALKAFKALKKIQLNFEHLFLIILRAVGTLFSNNRWCSNDTVQFQSDNVIMNNNNDKHDDNHDNAIRF